MLREVRQHMDNVRKDMRGLRELCIARRVTCSSSGNVTGRWRILHEKDWFSAGGLVFQAKGLFLPFAVYVCIGSKKGFMGRGTPSRGGLKCTTWSHETD